MELKRILARDTRSATEKAMALFGPDVDHLEQPRGRSNGIDRGAGFG